MDPTSPGLRRRSKDRLRGLDEIGLRSGGSTPRTAARAVLGVNQQMVEQQRLDALSAQLADRQAGQALKAQEKLRVKAELEAAAQQQLQNGALAAAWRAQEQEQPRETATQKSQTPPFPFTGGDAVEAARQQQNEELRAELERMQELGVSPPRRKPRPVPEDALHPFYTEMPVWLRSAREHCTRRQENKHVQAALQHKVASDFEHLHAGYRQRKAEGRYGARGLASVDSLTGHSYEAGRSARLANAQVLRDQIAEFKERQRLGRQLGSEQGVFGLGEPQKTWTLTPRGPSSPPEAELKNNEAILAQIEVDKARRRDQRQFELDQDELMLQHAAAGDQEDAAERWRKRQQRLLKESWDQQVQLKTIQEQMRRRHLGYA